MSEKLVETGTLFGIEVEGVAHKRYTLRAATVADVLKVEAAVGEKGTRQFQVALLAEQLEQLGTLTKKEISAKLLGKLPWSDILTLLAADTRLEERLQSFRSSSGPMAQGHPGAGVEDGVV